MYYICKFRAIWTLFDDTGSIDLSLDNDEIERITRYFAGLFETGKILTGLQIVPIPPNKLNQSFGEGQYVICKTFSQWLIFDGSKQSDRSLDEDEIVWIKSLVPHLFLEAGNSFNLLITSIQGNKLLQLSLGDRPNALNTKF